MIYAPPCIHRPLMNIFPHFLLVPFSFITDMRINTHILYHNIQLTRFFTTPWLPLTLAFWHETIVFVSIKAISLHVIISGGDLCGAHVTLGYTVARRSTVESDSRYFKTSDTGPTQDCLWWRMRCYSHYVSRSTW